MNLKTALLLVTLAATSLYGKPLLKGKAVFIGDGDTITVKIPELKKCRIVRLYGIDCPELHQIHGIEARNFTKSLLSRNNRISLEIADEDKYHRLVALIRLSDGSCLNARIAGAGLAWAFHPFNAVTLPAGPDGDILDKIRKLEKKARKKRIGIWADDNPQQPWTYRRRRQAVKTTVFVTRTGTCFHREKCSRLKNGADTMTLREALKKGYKPCRLCKPLTGTGTRKKAKKRR